jgi:hypothetical protein
MTMDNLTIPDEVFEQFELVRNGGGTNMMDRLGVQYWADQMECYELVCWIEDAGKRGYAALLTQFSAWKEARDSKA